MSKEKSQIQKSSNVDKKEDLIFIDDPRFDAEVIKILVEHNKAFKELAK